jgi:predicted kinase
VKKRDRLDGRLRAGRLGAKKIDALAQALAAWHAEPVRHGGARHTPVGLARRMREVIEALPGVVGLPAEQALALRARLEGPLREGIDGLLERLGPAVRRRLHGGLRCDSVWIRRGPEILFGPAADEAAGDPAYDLGCLCADLTARGGAAAAERLLAAYAFHADAYGALGVLDFYERLAACELAAQAQDPAHVRALALTVVGASRRPLVPPLLLAVGGPVACGKSTLSRRLARTIGAPRVEADRVRTALFAPAAGDADEAIAEAVAWQRALADGIDARIYTALEQRAEAVLAAGRPLVMDACFPSRASRTRAEALAKRHDVPFWFVECQPSAPAVDARLARRDLRDGRPAGSWRALAESVNARFERPDTHECGRLVRVDMAVPVKGSVRELVAELPGWPEDTVS